MSKYTTEVRYICESFAGLDESVGANQIDSVLEPNVLRRIFGAYPIFSEEYRHTLESNIIRHFYTREIGFETVGLWRLHLNAKMRLIMPKYNELYKKQHSLYELDIFNDTNFSETKTGTDAQRKEGTDNLSHSGTIRDEGETNGENSGSTDGTNRRLHSDTPQGAVDFPIESETGIDNSFMSDLTKNFTNDSFSTENSGHAENTRTYNNNDDRTIDINDTTTYNNTITVRGKRGLTTYAKMFEEFAENVYNIDMLICEELEELFMGLW